MNIDYAYRDVLEEYPNVEQILSKITNDFAIHPVKCIILWGSIAFGDFSPKMSDIDIIVIVSEAIDKYRTKFDSIMSAFDTLKYKMDINFIEEKSLGDEAPLSRQIDGSSYNLQAQDIILLRKYSVVLWGQDCRREMVVFDEKNSMDRILEHAINDLCDCSTDIETYLPMML